MTAASRFGVWNSFWNHSSVKPLSGKDRIVLALNEKMNSSTIGRYSSASMSQ